MPKTILVPLPEKDFDPTESAIPWKILTENGVKVHFSTPSGQAAKCDDRMLNGTGLGVFAPILAADPRGREAYKRMEQNQEFNNPTPWSEIHPNRYDGVLLPGGHAPGMKPYLESDLLHSRVAEFFMANKPVGAICHGVVLASRAQHAGISVLRGKKTTALLASQELWAWRLTCLWLGRYYRTYPQTVEAEVKSCLVSPEDFLSGPLPFLRDNPDSLVRGFTVRDGMYLSARWPGDAHRFAHDFLEMLQ